MTSKRRYTHIKGAVRAALAINIRALRAAIISVAELHRGNRASESNDLALAQAGEHLGYFQIRDGTDLLFTATRDLGPERELKQIIMKA